MKGENIVTIGCDVNCLKNGTELSVHFIQEMMKGVSDILFIVVNSAKKILRAYIGSTPIFVQITEPISGQYNATLIAAADLP